MMIGAATIGDLLLPIIQGYILDLKAEYLIYCILILMVLIYFGLRLALSKSK